MINFIFSSIPKSSPVVKKVYRQQLRPGSGHLLIRTLSDGPTRVLQISNFKNKSYMSINWEKIEEATTQDASSSSSSSSSLDHLSQSSGKTLEVYVNLTGGIGISLIQWLNQEYNELVYACLKSLEVTYDQTSVEQKLTLSIQSIQVCNQLINAFKQNLLCIQTMPFAYHHAQQHSVSSTSASATTTVTAAAGSTAAPNSSNQIVKSSSSSPQDFLVLNKKQAALEIDLLRKFRNTEGPIYIEHLLVRLDDVNLQIEEILLWKLIQFFGVNRLDRSNAVLSSQRTL